MLSLASSSLAFSAPSTLARGSVAAGSRARPVFANENEMEPEGGWGVDNLMEMMDTADEVRARAHSWCSTMRCSGTLQLHHMRHGGHCRAAACCRAHAVVHAVCMLDADEVVAHTAGMTYRCQLARIHNLACSRA